MRSPCLPQKTIIGTPCNNICYSHESRCWVSKHETLITKMGVLRETSHSYSCCPSRRPWPTYLTCLIHCCYETSRREQERCSLSQRASRSAPGSRFRKCSSLSAAHREPEPNQTLSLLGAIKVIRLIFHVGNSKDSALSNELLLLVRAILFSCLLYCSLYCTLLKPRLCLSHSPLIQS